MYLVIGNDGYLDLKWSSQNIYLSNPSVQNYFIYAKEQAIKDKDIFEMVTGMQGSAIIAIAKLAGMPISGYEQFENDPMVLGIENELRSFLNSFDWKKCF